MTAALAQAHEEALAGLWTAAAEGRLHHALLLVGPRGSGKYAAALRLANGLLCAEGPGAPCGRCGPCKRCASGGHPDLFVIDPLAEGEEQLKVKRLVERPDSELPTVDRFLSLRAHEGGRRVVVLREFDRANVPAQNAMLKTLEEPGAGVHLLLVTSRPSALLATVQSRCATVRLGVPGVEATRAALLEEGLDAAAAERLARWAEGNPGRALELARGGALEVRAVLAELLAGRLSALDAAARVATVEGELHGKTPTARARDRARRVLAVALEVGRDALHAAAGVPHEALVHGDLTRALPAQGLRVRVPAVLDVLLESRRDVESNLAPEPLLDRAMHALALLEPRGAGEGRTQR